MLSCERVELVVLPYKNSLLVNVVLRNVTEDTGEEVTGERRLVYNANLHALHSLPLVLHAYKT